MIGWQSFFGCLFYSRQNAKLPVDFFGFQTALRGLLSFSQTFPHHLGIEQLKRCGKTSDTRSSGAFLIFFGKIIEKIWRIKNIAYLCNPKRNKTVLLSNAEIAQLVEHNLAKVGVASSSLVVRSSNTKRLTWRNGRRARFRCEC